MNALDRFVTDIAMMFRDGVLPELTVALALFLLVALRGLVVADRESR
jgi:hypothetical protein